MIAWRGTPINPSAKLPLKKTKIETLNCLVPVGEPHQASTNSCDFDAGFTFGHQQIFQVGMVQYSGPMMLVSTLQIQHMMDSLFQQILLFHLQNFH